MPELFNEETGLGDSEAEASRTTGESEKRSERRYQDLANKVAEANREKEELKSKMAQEKAELESKLKDTEFKASFLESSSKYPNAKEFETEIRDKHSKGYALEDAIVSTLASKGKLVSETQAQAQAEAYRAEVRESALGGSADTNIRQTKGDDPTFGGDRQKMREELLRLEEKGEIGLRF